MTKLDKAIAKLKKKIATLPEYTDLLLLLPANNSVNVVIEEHAIVQSLNEHVEYEGFSEESGKTNKYLLEICGLSYFESKLKPSEVAKIIEEVVVQERENPTIKERGCDWKGYSEDLRVCLRLSRKLGATDEVYPHMRDNAIGVFRVSL